MTERTVAIASAGDKMPTYSSDEDSSIATDSTPKSPTPDPDAEFAIERILGEAVLNGETHLCVEWENYPAERSTWEKIENLPDNIIHEWQQTKMRIERGLEQPYDIAGLEARRRRLRKESKQRHRRRREKRRRRGQPVSPDSPLTSGEEGEHDLSEESDQSSDSSIEAEEIPDTIEDVPDMPVPRGSKTSSMTKSQNLLRASSARQQSRDDRDESDSNGEGAESSDDSLLVDVRGKRKRLFGRGLASEVPARQKRKRPSLSSNDERDDTLQDFHSPPKRASTNKSSTTTTGYQGTARPASSSNNHSIHQGAPSTRGRGVDIRGATRGGPKGLQSGPENVFQLKSAKKRTKSVAGPSKEDKPILARKISDLRRLELHGRALADRAPDPSVLGGLINPATGYGPKKRGSSSTVPPIPTRQSTDSSDTSARSRPRTTRWADEVDNSELATIFDEPEEMHEDQDADAFDVQDLPQTSDSLKNKPFSEAGSFEEVAAAPPKPAPKKTVSFQDYAIKHKNIRFGNDSVVKQIRFGIKSKPITVAFKKLDPSSSDQWVKDLSSAETVVFDHMCLAMNALPQFWKFCSQIICNGSVIADSENSTALRSVKTFLSQKLAGLAYQYSDFVILIYPVDCKEWDWETIYGQSFQNESTALGYVLFRMHTNLSSFLQLPSAAPRKTINLNKGHRNALVESMHNLEFDNLHPYSKADAQRRYYIFFPQHSLPSQQFIVAWLNACDPTCKVIDCQASPTEWLSYIGQRKPSVQAILFHHSLVPTIARLTGVFASIVHGSSFWSVGCDSSFLGVQNVVAPYAATRLFPQGAAIFLTPSFIVAEPCHLKELLVWFCERQRIATPGSYKIVGCHKLREYLLDLAVEKAAERKELLAKNRDVAIDVEGIATEKGLSFLDCEARAACHTLVDEMIKHENMAGYPCASDLAYPDESLSPVVYAWDGINQDAEEPLIKWFAGWAMCNIERYRKFIILGTGKTASTAVRYKEVVAKEISTAASSRTSEAASPLQHGSTISPSKLLDITHNTAKKVISTPLSFNIPSKQILSASKARFKSTFTPVNSKPTTPTETPIERPQTEIIDEFIAKTSTTPHAARSYLDKGHGSLETAFRIWDHSNNSSSGIPHQLDGSRSPSYSPSSLDVSTQLEQEAATASTAPDTEPQKLKNSTPIAPAQALTLDGHQDDKTPNRGHQRKVSLDDLIAEYSGVDPELGQPENLNVHTVVEQGVASIPAEDSGDSPRERSLSPETFNLRQMIQSFMDHTSSDALNAQNYLVDADGDLEGAIKLYNEFRQKIEDFIDRTSSNHEVAETYLTQTHGDLVGAIKLHEEYQRRRRTTSRTPVPTDSPKSDSTRTQIRGPSTLNSVEHAEGTIIQNDGSNGATSNAGIVAGPGGLRMVPRSVRSNGTPREEITIRPGFVPDEDIERYNVNSRTTTASIASPTETVKDKVKKEIRYTSTAAWYAARKDEGKRWEHLDVITWETAVNLLKIRPK